MVRGGGTYNVGGTYNYDMWVCAVFVHVQNFIFIIYILVSKRIYSVSSRPP